MNAPWEILVDNEPLKKGTEIVRYCKLALIIQICGGVSLVAGSIGLIFRAHTLPPLFGFTADHRAITGAPKPLATTTERFLALCEDTINAALTRSEKGLIPELSDFLTPSALALLTREIEKFRPRSEKGYAQEFSVDPKGIRVVTANNLEARCMISGIMTSSSTESVAKSRHYWAVQLLNWNPTINNPLGWRVNDIFPLTEDDFFADDKARASAAAVRATP